MNTTVLTSARTWGPARIIILLVLTGLVSQFASDNFLPSLPAMAQYFSASETHIKLTIPIYMFGLCISQLVYGPISDFTGRKPIMLLGLGVFVLGSTAATFAPTMSALLLGRLIQGFGIGATSALFRSVLRDCFQGVELAKYGSYLSMAFAIVPPLAPITGGYIGTWFGWRNNFSICVLLGLVVLIILMNYLPETHHEERRIKRTPVEILSFYGQLLVNRQFLGYTLCAALAYGGLMCYLTTVPFLYQHVYHVSPVLFGWLAPALAIGFLVGACINASFVSRLGTDKMLVMASYIMLVTATVMLFLGLYGFANVWVVLVPMMFFVIANSFVFSNAFSGAFEPFPHAAGIVGALYACLQMLIAALLSSFAAILPSHSQIPLSLTLIGIAVALILNQHGILRLQRTKPA